MDTQLVIVGVGGALLAVFAFQVWRSTRDDMNRSTVSESWLAERRRIKEEQE
ncbi:MAG TPA: hypothetical protein VIX63_07665 [Vicinamibacterales bacterium]